MKTRESGWGAMTIGSYIIGCNSIRADETNRLFQHEYGHYLQSQELGPSYLTKVAIPSLFSAYKARKDPSYKHKHFATEQDANIRAFKYFCQHIIDIEYRGWRFSANEILGYDHSQSFTSDYNSAILSKDYLGPYVDDNELILLTSLLSFYNIPIMTQLIAGLGYINYLKYEGKL